MNYRQKIMTALHEVETGLNAGSLRDQRKHNEVTVENAREVMALTERRYELGLSTRRRCLMLNAGY